MNLDTITEDLSKGVSLICKWDKTGLLHGSTSQKMDMSIGLEGVIRCLLQGDCLNKFENKSWHYLIRLQSQLNDQYLAISNNMIYVGDSPKRWFMPIENKRELISINEFNSRINEKWMMGMDGGIEWVIIWAKEINRGDI